MIWGAIVGGLAGTVVLTTLLRAASELGLTRIDLPFLLGTAVTTDRVRAKAVGYALHFVLGLLFALAYYAIFFVLGAAGVPSAPCSASSTRCLRDGFGRRSPSDRAPADGDGVRRRRLGAPFSSRRASCF